MAEKTPYHGGFLNQAITQLMHIPIINTKHLVCRALALNVGWEKILWYRLTQP